MKGNRRADTKPEIALRAALHARGLRFRKDLPVPVPGGRPTRVDVVFPRARVCVFVDGCYWHGCPDHGSAPKGNSSYWTAKIAGNRHRDRIITEALERDGWIVLRLWEHVPVDEAAERVAAVVERTRREASRGLRTTSEILPVARTSTAKIPAQGHVRGSCSVDDPHGLDRDDDGTACDAG